MKVFVFLHPCADVSTINGMHALRKFPLDAVRL